MGYPCGSSVTLGKAFPVAEGNSQGEVSLHGLRSQYPQHVGDRCVDPERGIWAETHSVHFLSVETALERG